MKKLIVLLFISGILVSCNSVSDEQAIKDEIEDYESQIIELTKKVKDLEAQLPEDSNSPGGNAIKVRVMKVSMKPFSKYFTATGELEAINEAYISPEVGGQITRINVVEGQKVKKGQLLAKLNTSVIEKNIDEVKTQLDLAETFYKKQTELWEQGIGSERQYLETKNNYENLKNRLASLQEQYNMSILHSPINGFVEEIMFKEGELASPGMLLMQIVDLDNLHVAAKLSEAYLPVMKEGENVTITFPSFPDMEIEGPITRIGNVVNKQNRTFRVEIKIENKNGLLKPNLLVNILINDYNSEASLVVPSMIVREDLIGSYLYVAEKDGSTLIAKKKYIEVGRAYNGNTEVVSGITENDQIITDGYSTVSNGTFIEIAG